MTCPSFNEIFVECKPKCEQSCKDIIQDNEASTDCEDNSSSSKENRFLSSKENNSLSSIEGDSSSNESCIPGCICKPGTVRNRNHICIPKEVCSSDMSGALLGEWTSNTQFLKQSPETKVRR